jgi:putative phosphoserine phosphatase/1-acylglycerol-3-phosphate O-acyltransferase
MPAAGGTSATHRDVAVFDLDGTLIGRGSLVRFVRHLGGRVGLLGAAVSGVLNTIRHRRRDAFKSGALARVLATRPYDELQREGRRFAVRLVSTQLRDEPGDALERHRQLGHRLVLLTSALDLYADHVGALLDVDDVLAVRVYCDESGRCTGRLVPPTLTGIDKARELEAHLRRLGMDPATVAIHAYADGRSDRPFVRWAHQSPPRSDPARRR